jgi:hypothetical protein
LPNRHSVPRSERTTEDPYRIIVINTYFIDGHAKKIGPAIQVALWIIDRTTAITWQGNAPEAIVAGGEFFTGDKISREMRQDESARNIRNHISRLKMNGYLRTEREHGRDGERLFATCFLAECAANKKPAWKEIFYRQPELIFPDGGKKLPRNKDNPAIPSTLQEDKPSAAPAPQTKSSPSHDENGTALTHPQVVESLKAYSDDIWQVRNLPGPAPFHFGKKDGAAVKIWLRDYPDVTLETLRKCLHNRARSDLNASEPFSVLISKILQFEAGPLDGFLRPKGGNNGNFSSKSEAKNDRAKAAIDRGVKAAVSRVFGQENEVGAQPVSSARTERGTGDGSLNGMASDCA